MRWCISQFRQSLLPFISIDRQKWKVNGSFSLDIDVDINSSGSKQNAMLCLTEILTEAFLLYARLNKVSFCIPACLDVP